MDWRVTANAIGRILFKLESVLVCSEIRMSGKKLCEEKGKVHIQNKSQRLCCEK